MFENDEILFSQTSKGTRISCFKQFHILSGRKNNGIFSIVLKKSYRYNQLFENLLVH